MMKHAVYQYTIDYVLVDLHNCFTLYSLSIYIINLVFIFILLYFISLLDFSTSEV